MCTDDSGPYLIYTDPAHLDAVAFGGTMYSLVGVNNRNFGDDVEYTFDPFGPSPTTQLLEWDDQSGGGYDDINLETPPTSGAHWLRVRVVDAEGVPYENPSATVIVMVFVRDELHPDKPLVGVLEPRPDHPHVDGTELIFELAVMPGSFSFSAYGGLSPCQPLPDCPDPFAPECEDECGPIPRIGDAKVYLDEDFESCLPVEFPNCTLDYKGEIEEYLDAFVARGYIDADLVPEPGSHTFSAMLWYGYGPYPTSEAPIYVTTPLEIVSE